MIPYHCQVEKMDQKIAVQCNNLLLLDNCVKEADDGAGADHATSAGSLPSVFQNFLSAIQPNLVKNSYEYCVIYMSHNSDKTSFA